MLTTDEREVVTRWIRVAYADPTAAIIGSAPRTTGLALRIQLQSTTMWLRVGGVINRRLEDVEREGLVAQELRALGTPLASALPRANGSFAGLLHIRETDLASIGYVELKGAEVHNPDRAQAEALGIALRKLHDSKVSASARDLPTVEPLRDIDARLTEASKWLTRRQARDLRSIVEHAVGRAQSANLPLVVCHGDVRYANVRFEDDRPTLFDLEALGRGPAIYDLACMWRRRAVETGMTGVPEDWHWLCRGYEGRGALSAKDWALIPPLACLRAFWTMTLPIDPGATWGESYRTSPEYWQAHVAQMRCFGDAMLSGLGRDAGPFAGRRPRDGLRKKRLRE